MKEHTSVIKKSQLCEIEWDFFSHFSPLGIKKTNFVICEIIGHNSAKMITQNMAIFSDVMFFYCDNPGIS